MTEVQEPSSFEQVLQRSRELQQRYDDAEAGRDTATSPLLRGVAAFNMWRLRGQLRHSQENAGIATQIQALQENGSATFPVDD